MICADEFEINKKSTQRDEKKKREKFIQISKFPILYFSIIKVQLCI